MDQSFKQRDEKRELKLPKCCSCFYMGTKASLHIYINCASYKHNFYYLKHVSIILFSYFPEYKITDYENNKRKHQLCCQNKMKNKKQPSNGIPNIWSCKIQPHFEYLSFFSFAFDVFLFLFCFIHVLIINNLLQIHIK